MFDLTPYRRNHQNHELTTGMFGDSLFRPFFDMGDLFGSSAFRVDIRDEGKSYVLEAELPGVPEEQIDVSVENGMLVISANMNTEKKNEQKNYVYSERRMGRYQRSFDLDGIREEDISGRYDHGVLYLNLPKRDEAVSAGRRKIEISK